MQKRITLLIFVRKLLIYFIEDVHKQNIALSAEGISISHVCYLYISVNKKDGVVE